MAENFPKLGRSSGIHVHESNRSPKNFKPKQFCPRHFIIKLSKIKTKNFKNRKGKFLRYIGTLIGLSVDFLADTFRPGKSGMIHSNCPGRG